MIKTPAEYARLILDNYGAERATRGMFEAAQAHRNVPAQFFADALAALGEITGAAK